MAATGIYKRHRRGKKPCRAASGGACNCSPRWEAKVWDPGVGKLMSSTFATEREARRWRTDISQALDAGVDLRAKTTPTVAEALDELLDAMQAGRALDRSGKAYKPATVRSYRSAVENYLRRSDLAAMRLHEVKRRDVQAFVDALRDRGLQPATVHNKLDPLRVVYRRAIRDELVRVDPMQHLELPRVRGRRDQVTSPNAAARLIDALPEGERAMWAAAFYAGLRRGELRALRWADVDFDAGVVRVARAWDDVEGEQTTKTEAGQRVIPLVGRLRAELA